MKTTIRTIIAMAFLSLGISSYAQDTLIMANGAYLPARVLEVNTSEIKYKKADNPDGPTFVVSKSEVSSIRYKNGTVDKIVNAPSNSGPVNTYVAPPPPPPDPKIYPSGGRYISDGRRFSENELYVKLLNSNDPKITSEVRKAKTGKGLKYLTLGMIPCFVGGLVTIISEATTQTAAGNGPASSKADYSPAIPWFAGGVVFLGTGVGFSISHNSHKKKAIELYNQKF